MPADTPPLDATARAALREKADFIATVLRQAGNDAAARDGDALEWFNAASLREASDVILALLAAVERGEELAEGVRHASRERAILGVHHTRLPEMAERFDAAARAHPPIQETDTDA